MLAASLCAALALLGSPRAAGSSRPLYWSSTALVPGASTSPFDEYGTAAACSGDTALLGAPLEDNGDAHSVGAVYAFTKQDPGWNLRARIVPPDGLTGDLFGSALSLSPSATFMLIGAKHAFDTDAGKAYVFSRDGHSSSSSSPLSSAATFAAPASWSYEATLTAEDGAVGDHFGASVAISERHAVVGAPGRSSSAGAVYVFERKGSTWLFGSHQTLVSGVSAASNFFGASIAVFRGVIAVGSPGADRSSTYGLRVDAGVVEIFVENRTANPTTNTSDPSWAPATWPRLHSMLTPFNTQKPVSPDGTALAVNAANIEDAGASLDKFGNAIALGPGALLASAHYDDNAGYTDTGTVFSFVFDEEQVESAAANSSSSASTLFRPAQQLSLVDTTVSEVQTIVCAANSGTFILELGSQRTNAIPATAPLSVLKDELEALGSISKVDVAVLAEHVPPPYVETNVHTATTHAMVNVTEFNVTEIRNATNSTTNMTYSYNWTGSVTMLRNISTNTTEQANTTHTPIAQTTVCGDPLGSGALIP